MPGDPVAAVVVAVRDVLVDVDPGELVLVACSGGPDSLALAAAAARVAASRGFRAGAVVVDHGWTAAAARAGRRAVVQLKELGLDPVELVGVDAAGPGGPEAAARSARYAVLEEAAARHSAVAVLLGHTLDDQAETVLLGLGRGSGGRSLAGMPARRGPFRRPLLGLRRETTVQACAALGLRAWQDPANADPRYLRVRVRGLAAELESALGPGVAEALARTGDQLREDAELLDRLAEQLLAAARAAVGGSGAEPGDDVTLDCSVLLAAAPALRRRALLAAAREAGCPAGALSHRHAQALDRLLLAIPGAEAHLPGGLLARREPSVLGMYAKRA
jgi:tRNA(Ile)-lysidine synthase